MALKIILGSTSPRRHQLLREVGYEFEYIKPETEEIELKGESPRKMVERLATEKALDVFEQVRSPLFTAVILTADTTVVHPKGVGVLNKPTSVQEAERILKKIVGKTHSVLTAYVLVHVDAGEIKSFHPRIVQTRVKIKKLSTHQIRNYIASGEPMDKAGAYAAQGIGMSFIESIQGSYSNVVGLPMAELVDDFRELFQIEPTWNHSKVVTKKSKKKSKKSF